jgi:hypothetical protein
MSNQYDKLTEEEIRDYGEEFLHVVGKKARESTAWEIQQLNEKIAALQTALARKDREAMKAELDREIPTWRQINEDSAFLAALDKRDDYTNVEYIQLLKRAWEMNDTATVKNFFKKAAEDMGHLRKPNPPAPADTRPIQYSQERGYYRSNEPRADQYVTRQFITDFYRKVSSGFYKDNPQEKQRIEQTIIQAGQRGLVR